MILIMNCGNILFSTYKNDLINVIWNKIEH